MGIKCAILAWFLLACVLDHLPDRMRTASGENSDAHSKLVKGNNHAEILSIAAMLALTSTASLAQAAQIQSAIPANAVTVTDWYKQNVYDSKDNKIGEIMDVLVDESGKIASLIVGVGGFVGAGEKDVAVSFSDISEQLRTIKSI